MLTGLIIRQTNDSDLNSILEIHEKAFNNLKEPELVKNLLSDPSSLPLISLIAERDGKAVGHILFTAATLTGSSEPCLLSLLAPLAIIPDAQGAGIGQALVHEGLAHAKASGRQIVFVLGHPGYYPKCGFIPSAGDLGFEAPYPISEKDAPAWMVIPLEDRALDRFEGKVNCANALNRPEYWRE